MTTGRSRGKVDIERIVETAAARINRDGLENFSMNELATMLGVRPPSLYSHVTGIDEVKRLIAIRVLTQLDECIGRAVLGKSTIEEAVYAVFKAYRNFAIKNPGVYAAVIPAPPRADREWNAARERIMDTFRTAVKDYGFEPDEEVHLLRGLRSLVHGFVSLETSGSFKTPVDRKESFLWLTSVFLRGVKEQHGSKAKLIMYNE